jgi:hypothetical protein
MANPDELSLVDWWRPDPTHLAKLMEGVLIWNEWRGQYSQIHPVLRGAKFNGLDLQNADLSNVDFSGSKLSKANMSGANLYQTEFYRVDLSGADLSQADLRGAKFHDADLRGANLQESDLFRVDFINTKLQEAKFDHARCMATAFSNVDLSEATGLEKIKHVGPSNIDVFTLFKSGNSIPETFLHGAGIPDSFIEYIPSLISSEQVIQFYSCFISYSAKDEEFARRLYSRMRDAHLRVWFAPEDIKGGKKIHEQIDHAIQIHDKLLIVLSDSSMRSEWVITEIRKARKAEIKENRRKLFPIRLVSFDTLREWECFDADNGKDLAGEVREYFIPDFSHWEDYREFESAFEKLLKDLKADESA